MTIFMVRWQLNVSKQLQNNGIGVGEMAKNVFFAKIYTHKIKFILQYASIWEK